MDEQELLNLKHQIEQGKDTLAKYQGRKEALLESIKKDYGVSSVEEAQVKIQQLESEIEKLNGQIEATTAALENQLYGGPDSDPA